MHHVLTSNQIHISYESNESLFPMLPLLLSHKKISIFLCENIQKMITKNLTCTKNEIGSLCMWGYGNLKSLCLSFIAVKDEYNQQAPGLTLLRNCTTFIYTNIWIFKTNWFIYQEIYFYFILFQSKCIQIWLYQYNNVTDAKWLFSAMLPR